MKEFHHHAELRLPCPRDEVFAFFSKPENLQQITPPWLHFSILTPAPVLMERGAIIDYRLRVHGIPLRWRSEIAEWNPPHHFVDVQLRGPYRLWHHTHRFVEVDGETLCVDEVRYHPPGGALADALFVKRDVARIFEYRRERLSELFPLAPGAAAEASR